MEYRLIIKTNAPMGRDLLNQVISLRGLREDSFRFAVKRDGSRKRGCYTRGCEIFTGSQFSLSGINLSTAILYDRPETSVEDKVALYYGYGKR